LCEKWTKKGIRGRLKQKRKTVTDNLRGKYNWSTKVGPLWTCGVTGELGGVVCKRSKCKNN